MDFGKIEVEIEGTKPLLMNNPLKHIVSGNTKVKSTMRATDVKKEAEDSVYRDEKGFLYVPSEAILGTMLNGAKFRKVVASGIKYAAKTVLMGNVTIEPEKPSLGVKDYEVDIRSVVIPKTDSRILRARPRLDKWKVKFTIVYSKYFPQNDMIDIIQQSLESAGMSSGLLDFRPRFGTFKITKFKPLD